MYDLNLNWSEYAVAIAEVCERGSLSWVIEYAPSLGTYMYRNQTVQRRWRVQTLGM